MKIARGQALVEYGCLLAVLVAALCLPLVDGEAVILRLEQALQLLWQGWRLSVLSMESAP